MEQTGHAADIFLVVRLRLTILVLAAVLGALSLPGLAVAAKKPTTSKKATPKGPTAKQIKAAVKNAERSPDLWATVNQCTSNATVPPGDVVGIRGQMPGLGFTTTMIMDISVEYWNYTDSMFESAGASTTISLGKGEHGAHQGGVNFPFQPPAVGYQFLVRGTITFEWKLGSKVLAKVTHATGHGYPNVSFSNPPGFTAGTCTLT